MVNEGKLTYGQVYEVYLGGARGKGVYLGEREGRDLPHLIAVQINGNPEIKGKTFLDGAFLEGSLNLSITREHPLTQENFRFAKSRLESKS